MPPIIKGPTTLVGSLKPDLTPDSFALPASLINQYLVTAGGSNDLIVNGSVTPVPFLYTVPAGKIFLAQRLLLYIDDATAFSPILFGGITALTNGVTAVANDTVIATWKDNADIVCTMFDFVGYPNFGKATDSGAGRWTFARSLGAPIKLDEGEVFKVVVNDAMAGLTVFRAQIQGCLISKV